MVEFHGQNSVFVGAQDLNSRVEIVGPGGNMEEACTRPRMFRII